MKYYDKYKILQALESAEMFSGAIFCPETATIDYGVSFVEQGFRMGRDYDVNYLIVIDSNGARPYKPNSYFTKKGIKRLLKCSPLARARIDELWDYWIKDNDLICQDELRIHQKKDNHEFA
ncbi:hypothetical protein [Campylobacter sp. RM15925]|uniref:hypothetical protein n=1 Tax=Campylobacter sp. RM15925 TaxID=1705724 RepID=UPI0014758D6C|nr:hypothetical protein [Campylobacter sp. RM15925]